MTSKRVSEKSSAYRIHNSIHTEETIAALEEARATSKGNI